MDKYVSCEDCEYQNYCHQFDPFFGCASGKNKEIKNFLLHNIKNADEEVTAIIDDNKMLNYMTTE